MVLYNYTDAPLTLSLYAADVRTAAGGALAPAQAPEAMQGVGAWVQVQSASVVIPPRGQSLQRFRLDVPNGTVPGDYIGAVVAALESQRAAGALTFETRAARLIRVSVPGDVRLNVTVSRLRASRHGNSEDFDVLVRNTGNVLFTVTGAVVIDGGSRQVLIPLQPGGTYIIPGGETTLRTHWVRVPTLGRRTARAELSVGVGDMPSRTFRSPPRRLTYFPERQASIVGALLAGVTSLALASRKRRRSWLRRRREERALLAEVRAALRAEGSTNAGGTKARG